MSLNVGFLHTVKMLRNYTLKLALWHADFGHVTNFSHPLQMFLKATHCGRVQTTDTTTLHKS